jgi:hypothetical protein
LLVKTTVFAIREAGSLAKTTVFAIREAGLLVKTMVFCNQGGWIVGKNISI